MVEGVSGVCASLRVPAPRFAQGRGLEALLSKAEAAVFERPPQAAGLLLILWVLGLLGRKEGSEHQPWLSGGLLETRMLPARRWWAPSSGEDSLRGSWKVSLPWAGV